MSNQKNTTENMNKNCALNKYLLLLSLCLVGHVLRAQETVSLHPYFDPKDREILLDIDEQTGALKGVISLKQPWVDKAFSKDGKYLYTVSKNLVTKIDLTAFKVLEEKTFYEQPPKEEWENHTTNLPDAYSMRYKVSSEGDVLYLLRSAEYRRLAKQIYLMKKERDQECDKIKGGPYEEWKRLFDSYNAKIDPLFKSSLYYQGCIELMLYSNQSSSSISMGLADVGASPVKVDDHIFEIKHHTDDVSDTLIIIHMLDETVIRRDARAYSDPTKLNFEHTSKSIVDLQGLNLMLVKRAKGEFLKGEYLLVPLSFTGVPDYESKRYFESYDAYLNHFHQAYQASSQNKYTMELKRSKSAQMPVLKSPPPPSESDPEWNKLNQKKRNEAMKVWQQEMKDATAKFQEEMKVFNSSLTQNTFEIKRAGANQPIKSVSDARMVYLMKGNKLLIDRKYELELFDLDQMKSLWVAELDY